jgi:hypothetical protein
MVVIIWRLDSISGADHKTIRAADRILAGCSKMGVTSIWRPSEGQRRVPAENGMSDEEDGGKKWENSFQRS